MPPRSLTLTSVGMIVLFGILALDVLVMMVVAGWRM
jgi:hypothetical protein